MTIARRFRGCCPNIFSGAFRSLFVHLALGELGDRVMMGIQAGQPDLFCYQVNLDRRVRSDHPLRLVHERIDFSFVRHEVAQCYGHNGNVSVDPAVIMKMMFLLFFDDVKSERELMRIIPERLDYLWFLGYVLDDAAPDHSVLSKARARWGVQVFESLFVRIVSQCAQAGLVGADKLHVDSSLIDANASCDSVVKGPAALIAAIKQAYRAQSDKLAEPVAQPSYGPVNQTMVSTTDPEAALHRQGSAPSRPRYKAHRAVDDRCGVITATVTTPADVHDDKPLMGLIEAHEANTGRRLTTVVADSQYGTVENFRACSRRGIKTHLADLGEHQPAKEIFPLSAFTYDPNSDTYRCPANQTLFRRGYDPNRRRAKYATPRGVCDACPLRAQCTGARPGRPRNIARHDDQEIIEVARARARSREALHDRKRRRWRMEGSFADAVNHHGFDRSRWRGLPRQTIQDLLIAVAQNIRIYLRHQRRLRPAAAQVLRVLTPLCHTTRNAYTGISMPSSLQTQPA